MPATETDLIAELIEWLEGAEHGARAAEDFAEQLIPYLDDLRRRDANEEAAFASGHRAGSSEAWNAMRNFVGMRTGTGRGRSVKPLVREIAEAIRVSSGGDDVSSLAAETCAAIMRLIEKE